MLDRIARVERDRPDERKCQADEQVAHKLVSAVIRAAMPIWRLAYTSPYCVWASYVEDRVARVEVLRRRRVRVRTERAAGHGRNR